MKKTIVSMVLKQTLDNSGVSLNDSQKESTYAAFRKRAEKKSLHKYVEKGEPPKLLRLFLLGSKFNSTVEFLVKVDSFKAITESENGEEIGFSVELKSPLTKKLIKLFVWKQQFKAYLEIGKQKKAKSSWLSVI